MVRTVGNHIGFEGFEGRLIVVRTQSNPAAHLAMSNFWQARTPEMKTAAGKMIFDINIEATPVKQQGT